MSLEFRDPVAEMHILPCEDACNELEGEKERFSSSVEGPVMFCAQIREFDADQWLLDCDVKQIEE